THVPQEPFISSCIRAFQSGHNIYLHDIPIREDYTKTRQNPEGTVRSSVAIPIGGNDGIAMGVLYVVSEQKHAFTEDDQRILRMLSRMIKETLETYQMRLQSASNLRTLINHPSIVDIQFRDFLAEDDLISHIEEIMCNIQTRMELYPHE